MVEAEQEQEKEKEKKEKFRKSTMKEKMKITKMIEEKQEKEEDLIEIRTVKEMVPRRLHKYLKVFEKKKLERMLMRKT